MYMQYREEGGVYIRRWTNVSRMYKLNLFIRVSTNRIVLYIKHFIDIKYSTINSDLEPHLFELNIVLFIKSLAANLNLEKNPTIN
jgi:hypothetical protein